MRALRAARYDLLHSDAEIAWAMRLSMGLQASRGMNCACAVAHACVWCVLLGLGYAFAR